MQGPKPTKSLLGRLADLIDIKAEERLAGHPTHRRIRPMAEIKEAKGALRPGKPQPKGALRPGKPQPTNSIVRHLDGEPKRFYTDGSLRHATPGLRGHAGKIARKKRRKQIRNYSLGRGRTTP